MGSLNVTGQFDVLGYDPSTAASLITELGALGQNLSRDTDEGTRLNLADKARRLLHALETPRDTMMRHGYAEPSTMLALSCGVESGAWKYLAEHDGPFNAEQLGTAVGVDPPLMARLMRHLAAVGYLNEIDRDTYETTHFTKAMSDKAIGESFPAISTYALPSFANFHKYAAKTGWKAPTDVIDGNYQDTFKTKLNYLEFIQAQPDGYRFGLHMQAYGMGRIAWTDPKFYSIQQNLIDGFDSSDGSVMLVDVGGSVGHDLEDVLLKYPEIPGRMVLQDLPMVLQNATQLNPRIEKMNHDFNQEQPVKGARAYYLHSILHDWPDEVCVKILSNIKPALKAGYSKVLINDNVIPDTGAHWEATGADIVMLAMLSALERSRKHWEKIVTSAGLKIVNVWYPERANSNSLIECELA